MHLLSAVQASAHDVEEPVDLAQSPGEVVMLSAADTELGCLAAAFRRLDPPPFTLRLANLLRLQHPFSVDLWIDKTASRARFIVVRLLGGAGYWRYGLEQLVELCRRSGIPLAVLPGDDKPDPELAAAGTVEPELARRIWAYLAAGGIANARNCLLTIARALGRETEEPQPPAPLPPAAPYRPQAMEELRRLGASGRPRALLVFYRAHVLAGDVAPVDRMTAALEARGFAVAAVYVSSLRDPAAGAVLAEVLDRFAPEVILNATAFAASAVDAEEAEGPLAGSDAPVLQLVFAGTPRSVWQANPQGLGPRDLAMQVALPEVDGRLLSRAVAFKEVAEVDPATECPLLRLVADEERCEWVAELARAWVELRRTPRAERRIALVLANYPVREGRIANGVGLDTPESCVRILKALRDAGFAVAEAPEDGAGLIRALLEETGAPLEGGGSEVQLALDDYRRLLRTLPEELVRRVEERWGAPEADPFCAHGGFRLSVRLFGRLCVAIQPARGYERDPRATYHSPDLPPPHRYLAFYLWLRHVFRAQAVVHVGKHGNLEWLPGKALALSPACFPDALLGPLPHLYPFIVNDPGEGSQAKRRTAAVIVDHLTPPLARAESYGPLRELERLIDEYHEAAQLDPKRLPELEREIFAWTGRLGIEQDLGLDPRAPAAERLLAIDNLLCELKELQIRAGLHIFGRSPEGAERTDLLLAIARLPRGRGEGEGESLLRALARDLGLGDFDPLAAELAAPYRGARPEPLARMSPDPWRSCGDTVERLEALARRLVRGELAPPPQWARTLRVLRWIREVLAPRLDACGPRELEMLLRGLDGRFVPPGPSGAPSRGRPEVLPTGRNFYSVDTRRVPTPTAFRLGWEAAARVMEAYLQEHGEWPRCIALSAWGTANMRTAGEDLAQALALLGCRPVWEPESQRVVGVEVVPASVLGRPRVDVVLRVSGFFRDAFPAQMELFDDAVRAVAALEEPEEVNPLAAAARREAERLAAGGLAPERARRLATLRLFGSMPGAYGAGLQALIDSGAWESEAELADAYLAWGGYAYGRGLDGEPARARLEERLKEVELVLHNQDNREHDLLDSDDYYQFLGGLTVAVRHLGERQPAVFFGDHSRPEQPRVRRLVEEIGRVVRGRAANPKWIRGMMRHGYKGAFEIAATVDYLFAFAATTRMVADHHFEALFSAYLEDEEVRAFLADANPYALCDIIDRFGEAIRRGLWQPRGNRTHLLLEEFRAEAGRLRRSKRPEQQPEGDGGQHKGL